MKQIAQLALKSVYGQIDPFKKENTFEVFLNYLDIWLGLYDR